jgi:hypothetical protein
MPGLAVDPTMMNLVLPDAQVITGVDVDRAKNSPFGHYLIAQMKLHEAEAQRFMDSAGFDPRRDLREVLMASSNVQPKGNHGVVMVRGTFDETRIAGLAAVKGGAMTAYEGVKIITPPGGEEAKSAAFLAGNLVLLGDLTGLKSTIDRFRSASKLDAKIAARVQSAGNSFDAWVLTTGSPAVLAGSVDNPNMQGMMNGDLMKGIENLVAGVRFGASVEIGAEATARTERDAQALLDVLNFFVSMAQSNGPKGQGPAQLLESLQLKAEGRIVKLSLTATEQDVERMFGPMKKGPRLMRGKPVVAK